MKIVRSICFILICFLNVPGVFAFETDQFNLPAEPLADIGDEVSDHVIESIQKAVAKLNEKIDKCLSEKKCDAQRLAYFRSEDAIALEVFRRLGSGFIPFTKAGTFMNRYKFAHQPARFTTKYCDSIYRYMPSNYFTISPTVQMYGTQFGTDKIAHIFQQGYDYYKVYRRALAKGLNEKQAERMAINWGKRTESTYFGKLVSGVYSNADLYSNFAGMKFYQGLTHPLATGNLTRPPILRLNDGRWEFTSGLEVYAVLLRPFISDHLNEAWNPSLYVPGLRSSVRKVVRTKSCAGWHAKFPLLKKDDFETRSAMLRLWNGEDYGSKPSGKFVTIANSCF